MLPPELFGGSLQVLYAALFVAALAAGILLPGLFRPEGRRCRLNDVEQLAFLSGGRRRYREAVVAGLVARGALLLGHSRRRPGFLRGSRGRARTAAERCILALPPPIHWPQIAGALEPCVALLRRRLVAAGLLASETGRGWLRFWALLPWLALLGFGTTAWLGDAAGQPLLLTLLAITLVAGLVRAVTTDGRTRAGIEAVTQARLTSSRLARAPAREEIPLAVALFGAGVLAATPWVQLHPRHRDGRSEGGCGCAGSALNDLSGGCGTSSGCGGGGGGCGGGCGS